MRSRAQRIVEIWNARGELLYYPTFFAALRTGHRWLTFQCPACQQIGEVDLCWARLPPRSINFGGDSAFVLHPMLSQSAVR